MPDLMLNFFVGTLGAALSMAGLASLFTLFKGSDNLETEELYLLRSVILWSLCISVGSLLPIALFLSNFESNTVWSICSLAFLVIGGGLFFESIKQVMDGRVVILFKVSYAMFLGMVLVLIWALLNLIFWQNSEMYVWGILLGLVVVSFRLYLILLGITNQIT